MPLRMSAALAAWVGLKGGSSAVRTVNLQGAAAPRNVLGNFDHAPERRLADVAALVGCHRIRFQQSAGEKRVPERVVSLVNNHAL